MTRAEVLLETEGLRTHFASDRGVLAAAGIERGPAIRAVDGIDLEIARGETLGLVGESGSGKTTLAKTLLRLIPVTEGRILFEGRDISSARQRAFRRMRREMQMVFQEPHSSLSPRLKVANLLTEPYSINRVPSDDRYSVSELLDMVELSPEIAGRYPHELSGGQARRVGIARALALHPKFLVADEPTAGLDVSAAASILNLMKELSSRLHLTYLVITHDLSVVGYIADRVAVMYLGKLVEVGPVETVFEAPAHPYTHSLMAAVPEPDPRSRRDERELAPGEIPSPKNPPPGCRFHPRCSFAEPRSREEEPQLEEIGPGHWVACHFWQKVREHVGA